MSSQYDGYRGTPHTVQVMSIVYPRVAHSSPVLPRDKKPGPRRDVSGN